MINFPSNPSLNQEYSFSGKTWKWSGTAWEINSIVPAIGFTGSQGTTGFSGSQGFTGSQGANGFTGSQGAGFTGSQGAGFTGSQGATGFTGSQGATGFNGSQGVGFTGSQGVGFDGSQGATGFTGSKGVDGAAAVSGTNTQILFNDSNQIGASANLTFDKLTNTITINGKLSTTETWNNGATTFTHIKSNVTNTASATGSSLMDLQVDGVSKFKVDKTSGIVVPSGAKLIYGSLTSIAATDTGPFPLMNFTVASGLPLALRSSALSLGSTVQLSWSPGGAGQASEDLFVLRDAGNTFGQRNGVNAQTSRLYGTYTDASNYERGYFTTNVNGLTIGHEALGTGVTRPVRIAGPSFYLGGPDVAGASAVVTFSSTTELITWNGHGLVTGSPVQFSNSGGVIPSPIVATTTYYVVVNDANTFKIATNYNNATALVPTTVNILTNGTGTTTASAAPVLQSMFVQNFTGTDAVGAPLIVNASQGTGSGPGGSIIFRTATAGTTGSSVNRLTDLMVLNAPERLVDIHAGASGDNTTAFRIYNSGGVATSTISTNGILRNTQLATAYVDITTRLLMNPSVDVFFGEVNFRRDAANTLAQRNSTNAQTLQLYNTYTDASNYERAKIGWNTNVLDIGTEAAGTGTRRPINLNYTTTIDGGSRTNVPALRITNIGAGAGGLEVGNLQVGHGQDNARIATVYIANRAHGYNHGGNGIANEGIHRFSTDDNGGTSSGATGSVVDILAPATATNIFQCRRADGTVTLNAAYDGTLTLGNPSGYSLIDGVSSGTGRELLLGNSVVRAVGLRGNLFVTSSYVSMYHNVPLTWSTDPRLSIGDLILRRDDANILAQRNGTAAQTSRVYNTFTDASNYERAKIGWNTNVLEIGTENAGTGTLRSTNLVGGRVGIGIAAPGTSLDIQGDYGTGLSIRGPVVDGNWHGGIQLTNSTATAGVGAFIKSSVNGLFISHSGTEHFRITGGGNVGIGGASAPTAKLDIAETWNNGATTFTHIKSNVTDTASNAASLLMDLQVGAASKFKVTKAGVGTFGGAVFVSGQTNSGIEYTGFKTVIQHEGSPRLTLQTGVVSLNPADALGWRDTNTVLASTDLYLNRDASNSLAQRNGTNAQTSRIYGTYTDASNYERGYFTTDANGLTIGHQALGTGVKRPVRIVGPALASAEAVSTLDMSQTWNTTGAPTAVKLNVTDTASANGSLLMDLQVGGVSRVNVTKGGQLVFPRVTGGEFIALANELYVGAGGGVIISKNLPSIRWADISGVSIANTDLVVTRDAANTFAQRNGTTAQSFHVYNTFTDASNYERGVMKWVGNALQIGQEKAGTGFNRALELKSGHDGPLVHSGSNVWAFCNTSSTFPAINIAAGTGVSVASDLSLGFNSTTFFTSGSVDTRLFRDAAGTLAQRNGANAQTKRLYGTYTDASNYERGYFTTDTNGLTIGHEALGTGVKRPVRIVGPALASAEAVSTLDMSQTWNTTGSPTAIKMNITDTASNAASLLMDLQVGGVSKFSVDKEGKLLVPAINPKATLTLGDYATGFGNYSGGGIDVSTAGVNRIRIRGGEFRLRNDTILGFASGDPTATGADLTIYRDAADTLAQRRGTTAQTSRIYNTYTDASNYERAVIGWNTNVLQIGTEAAGTGTRRAINLNYSTTIDGGSRTNVPALTIANVGAGNAGLLLGSLNVGYLQDGSRVTGFDIPNKALLYSVRGNAVSGQGAHRFSSDATTGTSVGATGSVVDILAPSTATNTFQCRQADGTVVLNVAYNGSVTTANTVTSAAEATTLATVTKTQVASFPVASFRSGKLVVQAYDSVTGEVQISELLVAHNGTTASGTEYGVVFTGASSIVTYDVDISAGNVRLMATRTTANSTQYKISETLIVA